LELGVWVWSWKFSRYDACARRGQRYPIIPLDFALETGKYRLRQEIILFLASLPERKPAQRMPSDAKDVSFETGRRGQSHALHPPQFESRPSLLAGQKWTMNISPPYRTRRSSYSSTMPRCANFAHAFVAHKCPCISHNSLKLSKSKRRATPPTASRRLKQAVQLAVQIAGIVEDRKTSSVTASFHHTIMFPFIIQATIVAFAAK